MVAALHAGALTRPSTRPPAGSTGQPGAARSSRPGPTARGAPARRVAPASARPSVAAAAELRNIDWPQV